QNQIRKSVVRTFTGPSSSYLDRCRYYAFYCLHVNANPMAAANIAAVVIQPRKLRRHPLTLLPMIFRLLATSITRTSNGGAMKPFRTAVQNRTDMELMPAKLISMPTNVEIAISM